MKKGILFDLDGTLWDSSKEVAEAWTLASRDFQDVARVITTEDVQSLMGKTMTEIADLLFPQVGPERRAQVFEHCLKVENEYILRHGGTLMDGLEETLKKLKSEGYHLYIVSNCQVGYIEAFLERYGFGTYFDDFECFGATNKPKGENIRLVFERNHLDKAIYVGDTQGDYDAATFAGLPFILARMGYGTLKQETPYVTSLDQLPELVGQMMEN